MYMTTVIFKYLNPQYLTSMILDSFPQKKIVSKKNKNLFKLKTTTSHDRMRHKTFFQKEPETIKWLDSLADIHGNDQFVFYDIGANIGIYSLYLSAINPTCKIFAIEPESTNFSSLNTNIGLNGFTKIRPCMLALSDKTSFQDLHVSIIESGAGASSVGQDYQYVKNRQIHKQGVMTYKLDDLVNEDYFEFPNFIKIDVDGHENQILEGAQCVIADRRLKGMLIEYEYQSQKNKDEFIKYVEEYGFSFSLESDWTDQVEDLGVSIQNFIFTRNEP